MKSDQYLNYNTEDFVLDNDFYQWVLGYDVSNKAHWNEYILANPGKRNEIYQAIEIINSLKEEKTHVPLNRKVELWNKILAENNKDNKLKFTFSQIIKYAAILILLICIPILIYQQYYKTDEFEAILQIPVKTDKQTKLLLSDGSEIKVDKDNSKIDYTIDGQNITINDDKKILRDFKENITSFNQLVVPNGKRSQITLSDGTKVWLNGGSKLIYPASFKVFSRNVFIEGEAYFEVTKDVTKPFLVKTRDLEIKVLGTAFNVKAFSTDKYEETVLVHGSVCLKKKNKLFAEKVILKPNQMSVWSKDDAQYQVKEIDVKNYIYWVEGIFSFNSEPLTEVLNKIEKYYNLKIECDKTINKIKITGKLDLKEDYEKVLDGLTIISPVKYEKQGDKIVFSLK